MLHCLFLEELAIPAFDDNLHHIILGCRSLETMSEGFFDDRTP
jgi:hypothetical protein